MSKKFKRLAIISDCVHYHTPAGLPATENHIFKRQMEALAAHFEETLICCPFEPYTEKKISSTYTGSRIRFYPLPKVGGHGLREKIKILRTLPAWWKAFRTARKFGDIIYQRFPNNINIPGFFYFYFSGKKTFASYTGTWKNYTGEPLTYRFQKWLLKKYFKGPVWVYAACATAQKKFLEGFSPSYKLTEWEEETPTVQQKTARLQSSLMKVPVCLSVGALVAYKNQQYVLEACKLLKQQGYPFQLYLIGDGPLHETYATFIAKHDLGDCVFLTGRKSYEDLRTWYRQADFLLQAPLAEGFGKTPLEGFFHGVVPFLSDTAFAQQMTGSGERGFVFSPDKPATLATLLLAQWKDQPALADKLVKGRDYARLFTLENWADQITESIDHYFEN